jgi:hypothetical protein
MEINRDKIVKHVERLKLFENRLYQDGAYVDSNIVAVAIDIIEQFLKNQKEKS